MTRTNDRSVIRAEAVAKSFRRGPEVVHALVDVSLEVAQGELVTLVGPSGSGKTTLLSVLAGWERLDEGSLWWGGSALEDPSSLSWADVAVIPQSLGLVEELTIEENVGLPSRLDGGVAADRVPSLLERLGIDHVADRLPEDVSLGEQQRAAVARSLVTAPRLLIADEPTAHQDAEWTGGVLDVFRQAAEGGMALIVATHHRAFVGFADRILAIRDGRVREARADEVVAEGDEL